MADIFCGCGTVAFEAKRNGIDFWGCDINPVATLIAKVKSKKYQSNLLHKYLLKIIDKYSNSKNSTVNLDDVNERLKYWYDDKRIYELTWLKNSIEQTISKRSDYRLFFLCAFSNILKATSRWLTKSIKPQIDPNKSPADVLSAFKEQCRLMMIANDESDVSSQSSTKIVTANFLQAVNRIEIVDMIVTSPPYVTSYEYTDLHQLSSLWLGYAQDYRDLREGSIGSIHHSYDFNRELKRLNDTGSRIVFRLLEFDKRKARSVARYYLDMQKVTEACYSMLSKNGIALFIIGNTKYRGIQINNVRHLAESLKEAGFHEVLFTKRKISKKILTPYRDKAGRFTTNSKSRKVYSEEFILIGSKS